MEKRQDFAMLFSTLVGGKEEEGYSAIITKDQYEVLLRNFLMWTEEQETQYLSLQELISPLVKSLQEVHARLRQVEAQLQG